MFREETTHFYGIKFRFESSEDFIFLYSYYDKTDMYTNFTWIEERQILNELNITDITENSKDNIISIFFQANYRYSTTRYIIIIASEEEDNSIENFQSPCYLAKLATDKPNGVKIENFYSSGEDITLKAEVDISEIVNRNNNKYIVNIISQELRFDRRINFYFPKTFEHKSNTKEIIISCILI